MSIREIKYFRPDGKDIEPTGVCYYKGGMYKEIEENRKINDKAIETITKYADRLDNIQRDIDEIKVDVVRIVDRIQ